MQISAPREGSLVVKRGPEPRWDDFPAGEVDIWSWNVNGMNSVIDKGDLKQFFELQNPTVVCFNETKASMESLDKR